MYDDKTAKRTYTTINGVMIIVKRIKNNYLKKTFYPLASTLMLFVSVIAFYGCKDYKKLADEFEANLPDSLVFLMTYDNPEEDMHLVYYKNIDNYCCPLNMKSQFEPIVVQ